MRKMVIALLALGVFAASTAFASNAVRISQVYGGGGSATATFKFDYVELFNASGSAVDVSGWSIQYGSSTSTSGFGNGCTTAFCNLAVIPASTSIPACGYYLLQVGTAAVGATGADLPTPDGVYPLGPNMSATAGKVALLNNSVFPTACPVGGPVGAPGFIDAFAYGATSVCGEGTPVAALNATTAAVRNSGGMTDTDNNSADFTNTSAVGLTVHNSLFGPLADCLIVPTNSRSWGQIKTMYR